VAGSINVIKIAHVQANFLSAQHTMTKLTPHSPRTRGERTFRQPFCCHCASDTMDCDGPLVVEFDVNGPDEGTVALMI